jgi:hypothetical protein
MSAPTEKPSVYCIIGNGDETVTNINDNVQARPYRDFMASINNEITYCVESNDDAIVRHAHTVVRNWRYRDLNSLEMFGFHRFSTCARHYDFSARFGDHRLEKILEMNVADFNKVPDVVWVSFWPVINALLSGKFRR